MISDQSFGWAGMPSFGSRGKTMPENSHCHKVYQALLDKGYSEEKAAKIAQAYTGQSLATGKRPKEEEKK